MVGMRGLGKSDPVYFQTASKKRGGGRSIPIGFEKKRLYLL